MVAAGVIFCIMSWVMLFSKKRDLVREMKKEMERCLWAAKIQEFSEYEERERERISIRWGVVVVFSNKRDFVRKMEKYGNCIGQQNE